MSVVVVFDFPLPAFKYWFSSGLSSHHYAYFEQFDWLVKKFYTSVSSVIMNTRTIFRPPVPNVQ